MDGWIAIKNTLKTRSLRSIYCVHVHDEYIIANLCVEFWFLKHLKLILFYY